MLRYIEITNIALIDRASIEFGAGLCVLTGETGAGKSIIIDSINAALGAKTQKDLARSGSGGANVTAVFELGESYVKSQLRELLEENGLIEGSAGDGPAPRAEEIILSRDIGPSGRNTSRVNGRLVSSATLRAIGELIVDLHGQHENHSLMKRDRHIEMIDNYCGAGFLALRDEYSELYSRYFRVKRQIADLRRSESERVREIDILTYQLNEIKSVRPQAREDERLIEQIETLANAEKINNALDAAYALLRGGEDGGRDAPSAIGGVGESIRAVSQITAYSNDFAELSARLSEAKFLLEDIAATIRNKREAEDRDPGGLDKLSARLEAIERLKKKYGGTVREIHRFYKQSAERLAVFASLILS